MTTRKILFAGLAALVLQAPLALASDSKAVVANYTGIAHAIFEDSLTSAQALQQSINAFVANPGEQTQLEAKKAWKTARIPYQQSEVFRFGNSNVDDWEGQLNAWPLDEGLIDYVADSYEYEMGNVGANANIIANPVLKIGSEQIDISTITPEILASLNELGGSEANVATGYHAIEFLLWGQDLNGTGPGAGERSYTDYLQGTACTHGNCDRRAQYLQAVTVLLISDLEYMVGQWAAGDKDNYRAKLLAADPAEGMTRMLYGMGSLALGELAGERMKVSLEANSPEDEHDCFSDNTHNSHYYDALGIRNIYLGQYQRLDGRVIEGASLSSLVKTTNPELDKRARAAFNQTQDSLQVMVDYAEKTKDTMRFDQMISEGNATGKQVITDSIQALVVETGIIEEIARAVGVTNLSPDTADHSF
jgi:putative iron-regulated protein